MSLQPREITPVPDETARVARAAFPKGNAWLSLRDELGTIYSDEMFAGLYPSRGQPAEARVFHGNVGFYLLCGNDLTEFAKSFQ
jgi:transposase